MSTSIATADASPGLTSAAAAAQFELDGPNALQLDRPLSWHAVVLRQLRDTVILVLLVAAVLTAAVGDIADMAVILAVIAVNTALGASQELRSGKALDALAELAAPQATVLRDGVATEIKVIDVVRGDALLVRAGDIVAADAVLDGVESLQVDESALTGESIPVGKSIGDELSAGTVVTRGSGMAVVVHTGAYTSIGAIGQALRASRLVQTPLQRQLATLGRQLALAVSVAAVIVGALNLLTGHSVELSIVVALSLAVAAIPESLPAVVSLSLALAARRMAARGVLVRRLAAVEALGSITVLAVDKTGTLTEGTMRASSTWTPEDDAGRPALLTAAVLCNDAAGPDAGTRDDPTEVALVAAAIAAGIDVETVRARHPRTGEEPFDAATARMITSHRSPDGIDYSICKGSPEAIATLVGDVDPVIAVAQGLAAGGARVLGVATDRAGSWQLLGVIALADPARTEAKQTVSAFRRAGVDVVMITGDHPETAAAIARATGIEDAIRKSVYARVRPDGKSSIVCELRDSGEIVAMTGDGVNDAPALHAADIGVAMGRRGTEVAKQAADLVLTEDDLSALAPAIAEGRRAWDNLRRFLHYALSGGVAEVLIMLFGPAAGFALPLRPGQLLWVNLLTHGMPGVALGNEPAEPDVLRRSPRPPRERLLNAQTAIKVAVLAAVISAGSVIAGAVASGSAQTAIFVALTLAQLGVALAVRPSWRRNERNPMLICAVLLNLALTAGAVWWSPLQELLHTSSLGARDIGLCVLAAAPAWLVARAQSRRRPTTGE